ncbi:hypothetical protein THRCLA_05994 [Thraustotheca clavata]|uniref:BZIP domain-containing protein n=1 Tax=Thraustotheca clavata TaxID=74557 RepID=A0A1V9ZQS5_9STRA|nr:hypothetical protein THRCLA_05994 [Thraustotheca clavata]
MAHPHTPPQQALTAQEKKIRRRVQCKMNMRCYRERRKRNVKLLEDSLAELHSHIEALHHQKQLLIQRPLQFFGEYSTPMALTMQYKDIMSKGTFGPLQEAFFRSNFSNTFTSNGRDLETFINIWYKVGTFYARPNPLVCIHALHENVIRFEVAIHVEITRPLLEQCFNYILQNEDEHTILTLLQAKHSLNTVMERIFYFDQLEDGRYIFSASSSGDDRAAQMASFVAQARQSPRPPPLLSVAHLLST